MIMVSSKEIPDLIFTIFNLNLSERTKNKHIYKKYIIFVIYLLVNYS
jgi:hypothetical protein